MMGEKFQFFFKVGIDTVWDHQTKPTHELNFFYLISENKKRFLCFF